MLVNRPNLHPMAATKIKALTAKGLIPKPEHVVWLQDAAQRIRAGSARRCASMLDWPVECGGVELYPLSIMAMDWWLNLPDDMRESPYVQAFACAHSHETATLRRLATPLRARLAVLIWKRQITASPPALAAALRIVMGDEDRVEVPNKFPRKTGSQRERSESADYGPMVLTLCRVYPNTGPEYWTCQVSFDYVLKALDMCADDGTVTGSDIAMQAAFHSIAAAIEKELTEAAHA